MIGSGACIGAGLPPNPVATCPVTGAGGGGVYVDVCPKPVVGDGVVDPKLPADVEPKAGVGGVPKLVD